MHIDVEAAKESMEGARMLVLNSPSNPTGMVESEEAIRALVEYADDMGVTVVSDEVYEHFIYEKEHYSAAQFGEDVITVNAASKTYAMTGWRIGYAAGPTEVIAAAGRLQSHSTSGPNTAAQKAALAAITGDQSAVEAMCQEFDGRRQYMLGRLGAMPDITCPEPRGAFYAFPRIAAYYGRRYDGEVIDGSMAFSRLLLENEKVATVPGLAFGDDAHVRLSYATGMAQIEEAMNRIERFLDRLS
jgi:aspartate aminotransferase